MSTVLLEEEGAPVPPVPVADTYAELIDAARAWVEQWWASTDSPEMRARFCELHPEMVQVRVHLALEQLDREAAELAAMDARLRPVGEEILALLPDAAVLLCSRCEQAYVRTDPDPLAAVWCDDCRSEDAVR